MQRCPQKDRCAELLDRVHAAGVEQERARLARELHDHVGQTIVYLRYELDRLAGLNRGRAVQQDLQSLRNDLHTLAEELRASLTDLRGDVSDDVDMVAALRSLAIRVSRRGRLSMTVEAQSTARIAVDLERELWRVAQEAVFNAERHSQGTKVQVRWWCDGWKAELIVADDGLGLPGMLHSTANQYGFRGMRERAQAIGAQLEISSDPGRGTEVHVTWDAQSPGDDHTMVTA